MSAKINTRFWTLQKHATFTAPLSEAELQARIRKLISTGRGILASSGLEGSLSPGQFTLRRYRAPLSRHPAQFWVLGTYRAIEDNTVSIELRSSARGHLLLGYAFAAVLTAAGVSADPFLVFIGLFVAVINWPLQAFQFHRAAGGLFRQVYEALSQERGPAVEKSIVISYGM
jgi:hypothetical protein